MSITEKHTLDMAEILTAAYEIGDLINASNEVASYLYWKNKVETDQSIQQIVRKFEMKKEAFEQCERFGHFHPDYHAALDEVRKVQSELDGYEAVKQFKLAEDKLDGLLYRVSETIARSVSDTIKVPGNQAVPNDGGCGCSGGAGCGGSCG